jgi:5-formyltetrahydrofolate cyclo-ligase
MHHKDTLRVTLRDARRSIPQQAVISPQGTVATYLPLADEPDPAPLLSRASRLLLPRLLPDGALELCAWSPGEPLTRSRVGTQEPIGPAVDLAEVDVVIAPALAVDPLTGIRLGRGGGSYDRLFAHIPLERRWAVLASEEELVRGLPHEPHDQPVSRVVLPHCVVVIPPPR